MTRSLSPLFAFAACIFSVGINESLAGPILLTINASPIFQQQNNSPCVIGNPSCQNPAGFNYTLIPANTDAANLSSPVYTVDQIRGVAGNLFFMGIDLQEPDNDYGLLYFALVIDGITEFKFTPATVLGINNHGNGFSDWVLAGFDLTGFLGTKSAQFVLHYSDAQAAREQFFLSPASSAVP
jgi:hypothetical protein